MESRVFTKNRVRWSVVLAAVLISATGALVFWPACAKPAGRLYASVIGFLKLQRWLGAPIEAEAGHPVWHEFETAVLGEGSIQSNFYNVPVVPTTRIRALKVEEGDEVKSGQVLAELDDTQGMIDLNSAELAVASAKAQLQRVEAGSVNAMDAERPEHDKLNVAGFEEIVKNDQAKVAMYKQMENDGASSRLQLINTETDLANAELNYEQAKVSAGMSNQGQPQSRQIAANAVNDAQNLLREKQEALRYFKVIAPADGIVDRVLIRDGEFNQNTGNTGFIIASGMWFEADLDQRSVADLQEGMEATVDLEAYIGRSLTAKIDRIIPIVTFNAGGPETKTPVRPLGTGTPEWPATFKIRLRMEDAGLKLAPGMTGFARITRHRRALAISRDAVSSWSVGKGVVRVVDASDHLVTTPVSLGDSDGQFVEITGGLDTSKWVLINNPASLQDNDRIHITRLTPSEQVAHYAQLSVSQRNALQDQLNSSETKTQPAPKGDDLTLSRINAWQAKLKEAETKEQQAQENAKVAASQRDALQAQLKESQAETKQIQGNSNLLAKQCDALQAQLNDIQAKAQQSRKNEKLLVDQRDTLEVQLNGLEAQAKHAQANQELTSSRTEALQAQLKEAEAKARQSQESANVAIGQRDALQSQLKDIQAKAESAQKNGELVAKQRDMLQEQLKEAEARAQQAQKNGEVAASQRDALQVRLNDLQAKVEQAQKNGGLAVAQRDTLPAQLKDLQTKTPPAQKNDEVYQGRPDTGSDASGDTEVTPVATDSSPKTELVTQNDHPSNLPRAHSVRASSESKKGRHILRHRAVVRRERRSVRPIDWLRRHLAS